MTKTLETFEMNVYQMIVRHYVCDIHSPDAYWYSIGLMRSEI